MPTPALFEDDAARPPFDEPWQAQAFALVVMLLERGVLTNEAWAGALSAAIQRAQCAGDPDLGNTYYEHWLSALESLIVERRVLLPKDIEQRKSAWERAYARTPHGQPVVLAPDPAAGASQK